MSNRIRAAAAVRAAVGAAMVARPRDVAQLLGAQTASSHPVLRLLGLRHLAQAVVLAARPRQSSARVSDAVDGTHVLSCLLLAATRSSHRRPALRDAGLESAVLLGSWVASR